uniref:Uncharacterized protein n=1 Tax=viral metagenome TaxID=1070528 RepID=A0A6M3JA90_9ZZZZ
MKDLSEARVEVHSTPQQIQDFMEGFLWKDILREFGMWLEMIHEGFEDHAADDRELYRCQGRAEAIRY